MTLPFLASRFDPMSKEEEFWAEYDIARRVTSVGGELCKFSGACLPVIAVIGGFALLATQGLVESVIVFLVAALLAIAGAPIAALGTIATETKRQRRLLELDIKYR